MFKTVALDCVASSKSLGREICFQENLSLTQQSKENFILLKKKNISKVPFYLTLGHYKMLQYCQAKIPLTLVVSADTLRKK